MSETVVDICIKCEGSMAESKALLNDLVTFRDFPNSHPDDRGQTQSRTGAARLVPVMKCQECGHSFAL